MCAPHIGTDTIFIPFHCKHFEAACFSFAHFLLLYFRKMSSVQESWKSSTVKPTCLSAGFTSPYHFATYVNLVGWGRPLVSTTFLPCQCGSTLPLPCATLHRGWARRKWGEGEASTDIKLGSKQPDIENSISLFIPRLCPLDGVHSEDELTSHPFYLTLMGVPH